MDLQALLKPAAGRRDAWLAALLGVAIFWWFAGSSILSPHHVDWLLGRPDPAQHYTGWVFFRHQPLLQFPFGKNAAFGETLGSSIVFSDSLPLMAFVFRPFAAWLPADFQYFGLWILLCCVLQAVFAWKILALLTRDRWLLAAGTCFFVLSPAMLFRLMAHEALFAHWTLLAAIYLYLQPGPKASRWALLVCLTTMVHAYLVAMVGAIWFSDIVRRAAFRRIRALHAAAEVLAVVAGLLVTAWATGYFYPGSVGEQGFGLYRFNLAGLFNPLDIFSSFFSGTAYTAGEYEGYAYLGAGMLGLGLLALGAPFWSRRQQALRPSWFVLAPIVLSCILFVAYAASNKIAWLDLELWSYEVPESAQPFTSVFRASGRFVWPVIYWLQVGALALVFTCMPGRAARVAVTLLLAVQVADLSYASRYLHGRWSEPYAPLLQSSFWSQVPQRYQRVALAPLVRESRGGTVLSLLAAHAGMSVNSGYLARVDAAQVAAVAAATQAELLDPRRWRTDTLYVIGDDALWAHVVPSAGSADLAADVDGFHLLAPAWCQGHTGCDVTATTTQILNEQPDVTDFSTDGNAALRTVSGWAYPEAAGTWTLGHLAQLRIPAPGNGPLSLRLAYNPFPTRDRRGQRISIRINGQDLAAWDSAAPITTVRELHIPAAMAAAGHGMLDIDILLPDALSPQSVGYNTDDRLLGLRVQRIEVRKADPRAS